MVTAVACDIVDSHLLSDRFRPLPHVVWARQADATVLLDAERGLYYTLNEVGGRTWELLAAGEPLIEILRCLEDEYDAPAQALGADTGTLLDRLLETGLIARMPS